jgi:hypothetical protein
VFKLDEVAGCRGVLVLEMAAVPRRVKMGEPLSGAVLYKTEAKNKKSFGILHVRR